MRPIFNESFVEKIGLWVSWTMHKTYWKKLKRASQKKKMQTQNKLYPNVT